MFCTKCGKELNEGDRFCAYCGAEARAPRQSKNDEVVFNPPFKIEAQKKTEEILKAAEEKKDAEPIKRETISFNWNLDGFPTATPKKTEDVDFNWDSVLERKNKGFSLTEPAVEKIEPKPSFVIHEEHQPTQSSASITAEDIIPEEKPREEVMSIEELEKELFGEIEKEETKPEKKQTSNPDARFYTFNQKNDAFEELLEKEKERIRSMEDEYNRQFAEMDYTWVPDVFPQRKKMQVIGEEKNSSECRSEMRKEDAVKTREFLPPSKEKEVSSREETQIRVIEVQQPKTPNIVDLTKNSEEKTEKTEKKEDSPSNDKLRYSDIFPRVNAGDHKSDGRDGSNGNRSVPVFADEDQEEEPVKKHVLVRIIIALLVIALIVEGGLLAIKFVAPESLISQKVNDAIFKIADIFTGGQSEVQNSGEDEEPNYGAKDAYLSGIILEKSAGVKTIGTVIYSPELVYDKGKDYAFEEISSAEDFVDAEWKEASATYGEKLMEALISYYDGWMTTNTDKNLVGINTLEIGGIKTGEAGFYVLCKVVYAGADGEDVTQYQSVYAKISNGLMVINEIKEETL